MLFLFTINLMIIILQVIIHLFILTKYSIFVMKIKKKNYIYFQFSINELI